MWPGRRFSDYWPGLRTVGCPDASAEPLYTFYRLGSGVCHVLRDFLGRRQGVILILASARCVSFIRFGSLTTQEVSPPGTEGGY